MTTTSTPSPFIFNITSTGGDVFFTNFDPGDGLLWALLIFRTILVVLASEMAITWYGVVDVSLRFSQPFKNMYREATTAENSIFLDYLWGLPGITTVKAAMNSHWLVAWFSFVSFFSPTFPILVGGLFVITNTGQRIYFTITPVIFYLVFAYLVIYAVSVPLAWPGRDRRLPRYHNSIADYAALFYASSLLHDPESKMDMSGPNVTQRHVESRVFLEEKRYEVGVYRGVDAKCHFGIDVATLDLGEGEMRHVMFMPFTAPYRRGLVARAKAAKQRVRRQDVEMKRQKRRKGRGQNGEDIV